MKGRCVSQIQFVQKSQGSTWCNLHPSWSHSKSVLTGNKTVIAWGFLTTFLDVQTWNLAAVSDVDIQHSLSANMSSCHRASTIPHPLCSGYGRDWPCPAQFNETCETIRIFSASQLGRWPSINESRPDHQSWNNYNNFYCTHRESL